MMESRRASPPPLLNSLLLLTRFLSIKEGVFAHGDGEGNVVLHEQVAEYPRRILLRWGLKTDIDSLCPECPDSENPTNARLLLFSWKPLNLKLRKQEVVEEDGNFGGN